MATKFGERLPSVRKARRRERRIWAVAVLIALMVIMLLLGLYALNKGQEEVPIEVEPTVEVVEQPTIAPSVTLFALEQDLKAGESLDGVKLQKLLWPADSLPPGAITEISEMNGKYAAYSIAAGTPILKKHLSDDGFVSRLPVTNGMRAISIGVGPELGIEGWARPGTRVDVLVTYNEGSGIISKVITQNAKVLSTDGEAVLDRRFTDKQKDSKGNILVTLEVTPADALGIQTARSIGTLSLILRPDNDNRALTITSIDSAEVQGAKKQISGDSCRGGRIRIEGKDYLIGCGGQIEHLMDEK